jgi:hypothetical protein
MAAIHLDIKGLELEIFTDLDDALHWLERSGTTNDLGSLKDRQADRYVLTAAFPLF